LSQTYTGKLTAVPQLESPTALEWSEWIARAIDGEGVRAVYQPVVDLRRRVIVGYEGLTRFSVAGRDVSTPDQWFSQAHELGVGAELEARALEVVLARRREVPANCFLAVNVDPNVLIEPAIRDVFARQGHLSGIVIELTEHRRWDWDTFDEALHVMRALGASIAIDDAGAGYSGLQQVLQLRPQILKLDRGLVAGLDGDEAKVALIEMIGVFADRINAWVLAEGIETTAEARRLCDLNVPLAQGYLFGRPTPDWQQLDPEIACQLRQFAEEPFRRQLHNLVEPVIALRQGDDTTGWIDLVDPWRAVIDTDRHPLGLVDPAAIRAGTLIETLVTNVHTTPQQVARRLATGIFEPGAPVIVTDDHGRYIGLVSVRRLLSELGR
jgi:EAL domain-containing protein (putative c-di-GMP-specific phosphodiesterase class I)